MNDSSHKRVALADIDERHGRLRLVRPDVLGAVRRSVARHGVLHPLIVNATADDKMVLLDGFKRLAVVRESGDDDVLVQLVQLDEVSAHAAMLTYNAGHRGGMAELEQAWVVRSLVRGHKLRQKDVAALLGRHKTWVCRRLMLAEHLDDGVEADMRLGLIGASIARELVRLPRGNQQAVALSIRDHGLTSRQAAALVDRYLRADDPDAVADLLADPLKWCGQPKRSTGPGRAAMQADPRLGDRAAAVHRQVRYWLRASDAVCNEASRLPAGALGDEDLAILGLELPPAIAAAHDACGRLRALLGDASAREPCDG